MPAWGAIATVGLPILAEVGMGIYDRIRNSDLRRVQDDVFNQQIQFNADLQRRARGKFTESELATIKGNAEPQINAVAGNVSARLGASSPAGAALIAQAQQAPINAAMQAATGQYGASMANLAATVKGHLGSMSGDKSFIEDLTAALGAYQRLKSKPDADPDVMNALRLLSGQGYQAPKSGYEKYRSKGYSESMKALESMSRPGWR